MKNLNIIRIWSGKVPANWPCALEYGEEGMYDFNDADRKAFDTFQNGFMHTAGAIYQYSDKVNDNDHLDDWFGSGMGYGLRTTFVKVYQPIPFNLQWLIGKMKNIVDYTMTTFESDFYKYDIGTICRHPDCDFIWQIDRSHTYIARFDRDADIEILTKHDDELDRWRNGESWGECTTRHFEGSKYWYYDHKAQTFHRITTKRAQQLCHNYRMRICGIVERERKAA